MNDLREIAVKTLCELARRYPSIFVLTPDLGRSTRASLFGLEFPDRYLEIGFSQESSFLIACGLSRMGFVPFLFTYSVFVLTKGLNSLLFLLSYERYNVKVVGTHSGCSLPINGPADMCFHDRTLFTTFPNIQVYEPSDESVCKIVIKNAADKKGPCYIRLSKEKLPKVYHDERKICREVLNNGFIISGEGSVLLVTTGAMVHKCMEIKKILERENINVAVVDVVSPTYVNVSKLSKILERATNIFIVADHATLGGLSSLISPLSQNGVKIHNFVIDLRRHGWPFTTTDPNKVMSIYGIDTRLIIRKIREEAQ